MRTSVLKTITLGFLCLITLTSCKDSSSNSGEETSVEGLWLTDSNEGDISYVHITNTIVSFYDYQGDDFDQGEDCYIIGREEILEIDGNIYKFADPENPGKTIDIRLTAQGNKLTVVQPFGNGSVTVTFTRHNGNISSFTPECTEEETVAIQKAQPFGL
ncbi:MAG: hypothetical protein U5J63_17025 [Fodinibius sp.]|nr:hypothetical protein [Fodinibius sp.]